jgi:hypothetical protein
MGQDQGEAGPAAHVEEAGAIAYPRSVQDGLEQRAVVRLGEVGPGPGVGAPQAALDPGRGGEARPVAGPGRFPAHGALAAGVMRVTVPP